MRSNDRVTHFAVAATKLAIEDAGVDVEACGERCGVMVRNFERVLTLDQSTRRLCAHARKESPTDDWSALEQATHAYLKSKRRPNLDLRMFL